MAVRTIEEVAVDQKLKDSCFTPGALWDFANDKTASTRRMNWDTSPMKPAWDAREDFCFIRDRYPGVLNRANGPWSLARAAGPKAVVEMLRGASTIMITPHNSVHNRFGRTILACLGYPLRLGPVTYKPHTEPNKYDSAMTLVLTPQLLQYIQNNSRGR